MKLQKLLDEYKYKKKDQQSIKKEIISLSLKHHFVTEFTTMIVVDEDKGIELPLKIEEPRKFRYPPVPGYPPVTSYPPYVQHRGRTPYGPYGPRQVPGYPPVTSYPPYVQP